MSRARSTIAVLSLALSLSAGCANQSLEEDCGSGTCENLGPTSDEQLLALLDSHGVAALDFGPAADPRQVELGRALFFDRELSGNRDISCATCHHPLAGSGDDLALPIGTGGRGLATERVLGEGRGFIPRNAPEVFNRGADGWNTMFWDSRVSTQPVVVSPAGKKLPASLSDPLAIQAMFPPTSAAEMRGAPGDLDVFGYSNELALLAEDDVTGIWQGIMERVMAIDEYQRLFAAAFPSVSEPGFEHAATAIAAFEKEAFAFADSPFDRYLAGDTDAMSPAAKRGAILFYGDAGCGSCHSGSLMTDQKSHSICAPQLGPGKAEGDDLGVQALSSDSADAYAFRTPPLRNVETTGPWMHSGAYADLELAVRHHLDPIKALMKYDESQLPPSLRSTLRRDPDTLAAMGASIDPLVATPIELDDNQFDDLMSFLYALTDPRVHDMASLVPSQVPSGLPLD